MAKKAKNDPFYEYREIFARLQSFWGLRLEFFRFENGFEKLLKFSFWSKLTDLSLLH